MTEKEKKRRNVHLSPQGYVLVFMLAMLVGFAFLINFPSWGWIVFAVIAIKLFFNFPTTIEQWDRMERNDPKRKKDRIF